MAGRLHINFESLVELSVSLNKTHDEGFILKSALFTLMGKLRVLRACIYLPDMTRSKFIPQLWKGRVSTEAVPYFEVDAIISNNLFLDGKFPDDFFYKLVIPLIYHGQNLAIICLGENIENSDFEDDEIQYAQIVAFVTANALQDARNHLSIIRSKTAIEKRNQLLSTLFEVSKDFSILLSKNDILKMLSHRIMGQLMVSRFAIILKSNNNSFDQIVNRFEKQFESKLIAEIFNVKETTSTDNIQISEKSADLINSLGVRIISPMMVQGLIRGMLLVGRKMNNLEFTEENIKFIDALGSIAISSLENERLFLEELEKKKLENELELALEIQKNLLPKVLPIASNYEFYGTSVPSLLVGGDYFDFIKLTDDKILVAIADVSGKGMPAALLMANVQAALRALAPLELPLRELIIRINRIVYQNTSADKFVTFFAGILDTKLNEFQYINAGHNPPLLFRSDGNIVPLTEGGIILGITDIEMDYFDNRVNIEPDDFIILYTDGATEAMDSNDREFSEENLINVLLESSVYSLEQKIENLLKTINKHSKGMHQTDDITFACLKRQN